MEERYLYLIVVPKLQFQNHSSSIKLSPAHGLLYCQFETCVLAYMILVVIETFNGCFSKLSPFLDFLSHFSFLEYTRMTSVL